MHSLEQINTDELLNSNSPIDGTILNFDHETLINNLTNETEFQNQPIVAYFPPSPAHYQKLPEVEEMAENDWGFNMDIKSDTNNKSMWLFSAQLNKVFVKLDTPLNVYPSFNTLGLSKDKFFIRAMIVYTSQNDLPEPVIKCPNHRAKGQREHPDHILHCGNRSGVAYVGDSAGKIFGDRLACVVNMGSVASNEPLKFEFSCQNSCSGGMNRRSTTLVFTLEDELHNVLGRSIMHFKVCSCPRRDKDKDESTSKILPKKRKHDGGNTPSTSAKRIHLPRLDSETALLPELNSDQSMTFLNNIKFEPETPCELKLALPNENIKKEVLRFAYNAIAGEMTRTGQMAFNCFLTEIQKQIGK